VALTDVSVAGTLKSMTARSADLSGTLYATCAIGKVLLRNVTGTIASAAGSIGAVQAANMTDALVLSGANFGNDLVRGGGDDSYGAGSIASIQVSGAINSSLIGAGLNLKNGTFPDSANTIVGGPSSTIKSIKAGH